MNILDRLGIECHQAGNELVALCPMHEARTGKVDTSPSWSINTVTGLHHCFSCGYGGNAVTLVADVLRIGRDQAIAWLGDDRPTVEALKARVEMVRPVVVHEEPFDPLWFRSFDSVPDDLMAQRGILPSSCEKFGLRYRDGWAIPICDPDGHMIGWQQKSPGRVRNHPTGVRKSQTLFGLALLTDSCVVVESPLDAVLSDQYGHPAVATFGASVSDTQIDLIAKYDPVLAFDNDEAGRAATSKVSRALQIRGVIHRIVEWPSGVKDFGDAPELIPSMVMSAVDPVVAKARRMAWY